MAKKKAKRKYKRKLSVAPHRALRRYCRRCKVRHSKMSHRSHGHGSYAKTRGKKKKYGKSRRK